MYQTLHTEESIRGIKGAIHIVDTGTEGGVEFTCFFVDDHGDVLALVFPLKMHNIEPFWVTRFKFPNELLVYTVHKTPHLDKGVSFWYHDKKLHLLPYYRAVSIEEWRKLYSPEIILDQTQINSVVLELETIVRRNTITETRI